MLRYVKFRSTDVGHNSSYGGGPKYFYKIYNNGKLIGMSGSGWSTPIYTKGVKYTYIAEDLDTGYSYRNRDIVPTPVPTISKPTSKADYDPIFDANGNIIGATVVDGGSGYSSKYPPTVSLPGGFIGKAVIVDGKIVGVTPVHVATSAPNVGIGGTFIHKGVGTPGSGTEGHLVFEAEHYDSPTLMYRNEYTAFEMNARIAGATPPYVTFDASAGLYGEYKVAMPQDPIVSMMDLSMATLKEDSFQVSLIGPGYGGIISNNAPYVSVGDVFTWTKGTGQVLEIACVGQYPGASDYDWAIVQNDIYTVGELKDIYNFNPNYQIFDDSNANSGMIPVHYATTMLVVNPGTNQFDLVPFDPTATAGLIHFRMIDFQDAGSNGPEQSKMWGELYMDPLPSWQAASNSANSGVTIIDGGSYISPPTVGLLNPVTLDPYDATILPVLGPGGAIIDLIVDGPDKDKKGLIIIGGTILPVIDDDANEESEYDKHDEENVEQPSTAQYFINKLKLLRQDRYHSWRWTWRWSKEPGSPLSWPVPETYTSTYGGPPLNGWSFAKSTDATKAGSEDIDIDLEGSWYYTVQGALKEPTSAADKRAVHLLRHFEWTDFNKFATQQAINNEIADVMSSADGLDTDVMSIVPEFDSTGAIIKKVHLILGHIWTPGEVQSRFSQDIDSLLHNTWADKFPTSVDKLSTEPQQWWYPNLKDLLDAANGTIKPDPIKEDEVTPPGGVNPNRAHALAAIADPSIQATVNRYLYHAYGSEPDSARVALQNGDINEHTFNIIKGYLGTKFMVTPTLGFFSALGLVSTAAAMFGVAAWQVHDAAFGDDTGMEALFDWVGQSHGAMLLDSNPPNWLRGKTFTVSGNTFGWDSEGVYTEN
jgi:hypothetical protein